MWWFTPAALLTISLAVYTYAAAHVYTFSPLHTQREAAATVENRATEQAQQDTPVQWLRLWPGDTIALMPFEIPVPADGMLTAMPPDKQPDRASLSVPNGLSGLLTFYRAELSASGWHEVRSWMARPVGTDVGPGNAFSVFCRASDGPFLVVAITHDPTDGRSSLHLRLSGEQPGPCNAATLPTPGDGATPRDGPSPQDRTMPPLF